MKRQLIAALWLCMTISACAQLGTVHLGNSSGTPIYNSLFGTNVHARVALYGSTQTNLQNDSSLVQVGATVDTFAPGLFNGGTRHIGMLGDLVTLQVRAWTGGFATYELAISATLVDPNVHAGATTPWMQTVGGGIQPTALIIGPGRFQGLDLAIPEPSRYAIALLGVLAFAMFRRRRSSPHLR